MMENHQFEMPNEIMNRGNNYEWMLKALGNMLM